MSIKNSRAVPIVVGARHLMHKSQTKGEIMRNAQRLIAAKGDSAVEFAHKMVGRMEEEGNNENHAFWERIAAQVELLIYEPPADNH